MRTRRENSIPKTAARRLAKLLSHSGEAAYVEEHGCGMWSDHVSDVARKLGLVSFDTEGDYIGYSSTEPSFVDNEIEVEEKAWRSYLDRTPLQKERALLDVHLDTLPSEFFQRATLVEGKAFDRSGCATGPASRMKLAQIRRSLLQMLAGLPSRAIARYGGRRPAGAGLPRHRRDPGAPPAGPDRHPGARGRPRGRRLRPLPPAGGG